MYKITLTAKNGNKTSTTSKNVTVEAPTKCYFAGITYKSLSVNNKYITFKLIDDDVFTTTWITSVQKLLSTANLPFQFTLATPKLLDGLDEDEYYMIEIYSSGTKGELGSKIAGFKFYTTGLSSYPMGIDWKKDSNGNQISCQFKWE